MIGQVYKETGYLCDPHGATGYRAAQSFRKEHPDQTGIFLETAHPAKFKESVEEVIGETVEVPERLAAFANREKHSIVIQPDYDEFRQYLLRIK